MSETTIYDMGFDLIIKDEEIRKASAKLSQMLTLYENYLKN